MPELPEVEHIRREMSDAIGARIESVPTAEGERWGQMRDTAGMRIERIERRGKYLLLILSEDGHKEELVAVIHLGMTGQLRYGTAEPDGAHLRAHWKLDNGKHVSLNDARGFGSARLTSWDELAGETWAHTTLARLGQDPLEQSWDAQRAGDELKRRSANKAVKAALLEQRAIAGIGNYLADETCWRARVHPAQTPLSTRQARALARSAKEIIDESVEAGGVSMRDYIHADGSTGSYAQMLHAYGRAGLPCTRCSTSLVKTHIAGRGTTYCPKCQKLTENHS